jgi:tetratricopeptide (TPR) repeat protein
MKHHPAPESLYVFGITLGLLAYTGDSFFSFPKERMESTFMFWIGVGAVMRQTASCKSSACDMRPIAWLSIPILLCGLSLSYRHLRFDQHYLNAQNAWREKNWPRLQTETEKAWTWGPFNQRAMLLNGLSYHQQQKYPEAISAYQTAQHYHPNDGHDALASVYAALGKWDLALKHQRAEWRLYPKLPNTWLALINTYEQLEQIDNATNIAQQALEQGIRSAELMMRAGHLFQLQNNLEKALDAYGQAQQLDPQNPVVFNNIGAILMRQKKYPEAEKAYLHALQLQPDYSRVYHNLGDLYATQGDTTKALKAYAMFIQAWQGDPRFAKLAEQKINALKNISPK